MRYPHTKLFSGPRHIVVLSGPHIQVLDTHGRLLNSTAIISQENALVNSGPIHCSSMSKDGRYLATAGDDKRLKIWDVDSLTLLRERELPKRPTCIKFSGNTNILVSDKFGDVFRYTLSDVAVDESPSSGELILGHASLLTSFLLAPDENFIITADRDEHIRVSWYPEGYVIQSFCLGHKKYVSAIYILSVCPARLISGGGDPELKIWDWMTGDLHMNIVVFPTVEPFIKVGFDAASDPVFVVRRIGSFLSGGENHVVFSVVGATAIFAFALTGTENRSDIRHYDFGNPVIDFTICGNGSILVLLDADFPKASDAGDACPSELVRGIQWSMDRFIDASTSTLLDTLNTTCSLPGLPSLSPMVTSIDLIQTATAEDLRALDLYSELFTLPKTIDKEQGNRVEGSKLDLDPLEDEPTGEGTSSGLTKRALGRLKHKRALDQLLHGESTDHDMYTKRVKANSDNEESHGTQHEQ